MNRTKKKYQAMPVKPWLSLQESCAYLDMSVTTFQAIALKNQLTTSVIGTKKYFKVNELNEMVEENILIRH